MEGRRGCALDAYKIPDFMKKDSLAASSIIVFAGSMATNFGAYVYHLLMGRLLGPEKYGELSSLLSLLYIFTVPLLVAQTVLVKFISGFKAHGEIGKVKSLFVSVTKVFLLVGFIGFPIAFITDGWVTAFLHLSRSTLFFLIYLLFVFSLLSIAIVGVLQGLQKFIWLVAVGAGGIVLKIAFSVPSVAWGVWGVVWAAVLASIGIYLLSFIPLRFLFRAKSKKTDLTRRWIFAYAAPTFLTLLGITSLYSTDIILIRHFFSGQPAGLYAALAVLGKIIFYASSAVGMVLFPVLSERFAKGDSTRKLVLGATGAVSLISFGLTLLYFLFPDTIVGLLFGSAYAQAGSLLGMFGIFIALFSVGNIVSLASLATEKTAVWVVPFVCATVQIIGIALFHGSIRDVILLNIGISALFAAGSGGYYLWRERTYA